MNQVRPITCLSCDHMAAHFVDKATKTDSVLCKSADKWVGIRPLDGCQYGPKYCPGVDERDWEDEQ